MRSYFDTIGDLQSEATQEIIEFLKKNNPDEAYSITSYCENSGLFAPGYNPHISKIRLAYDSNSKEDTLYIIWQNDSDCIEVDEGVYNKETHSFEEFEQGDWTSDIPMYNLFDIADRLNGK